MDVCLIALTEFSTGQGTPSVLSKLTVFHCFYDIS